jgi:DNA-binding response OmpR family regulator
MNEPMPAPRPADRGPAPGPVLVVDDDRKIVALVKAYLEREGYRVTTAYDGRQALAQARAEPPALIVLDLMLPELDGLEVLRTVRRDTDVPVLMLSARSTVPDRIRGIEKGADDYLPKPFSPAELVVRVKAILRRTAVAGAAGDPSRRRSAPTTLRQHDLVIDTERYEVRRGGALVPLTTVEFRLLVALVSADGRALTRDQLLDAVYGADDADVLDRTIDVHVGRLRDKLDDDAERPRYVMTVRGVGYRAAPPRNAASSDHPGRGDGERDEPAARPPARPGRPA